MVPVKRQQVNQYSGNRKRVEQMVSKAHQSHQSASGHITMHQCVLLYRAWFFKKNMHTHAYTSLDQLVRNADKLVTAKKRIEGVHHGASVVHHDASRLNLDTSCSIPFSSFFVFQMFVIFVILRSKRWMRHCVQSLTFKVICRTQPAFVKFL